MNSWQVYSEMKRHWYETEKRLTEQELRWKLPRITDDELKEGLIEFDLAFERAIQYEPTKLDEPEWLNEFYNELDVHNAKVG